MRKKKYQIEFTYSNDNEFNTYTVDCDSFDKKDEIIKKIIHELAYKNNATNIVVKETCVYKVL